MKCPECCSTELQRNGHRNQVQCYKCKHCGRQFLASYKQLRYPEHTKQRCLRMYFSGMSARTIEKLTKIHHTTILSWIQTVDLNRSDWFDPEELEAANHGNHDRRKRLENNVNDTGKTLVLIVDDAAFSRRMLRKYIEAEGYQVIEATNGQQALEMVQQHQPDCILTDLLMPDIDGFQLLQTLREQGQLIPIAIISADIQETSHQRGIELGATSFINKPAKEEQVRQIIRQLLQREGAST